jgi:Domain of unknown function (DUF4411)
VGRFWIDADALIQAKDGLFSFEIAAEFWVFLEEGAAKGILSSSIQVYGEIMRYEDRSDPLVKWASPRKNSPGLFRVPDKNVQEACGIVGDHVVKKYLKRPAAVGQFLGGADPWIIAHALSDEGHGTVVSHEARLDKSALRPKIPNVCHDLGIGCIGLPAMLKELKFKFGGKA